MNSVEKGAQRLIEEMRREIAEPTILKEETKLDELASMQQQFRQNPVGGKLVFIKKLFYWFPASAFDRQGRVIEGMLEYMRELTAKNHKLEQKINQLMRQIDDPNLGSSGADE